MDSPLYSENSSSPIAETKHICLAPASGAIMRLLVPAWNYPCKGLDSTTGGNIKFPAERQHFGRREGVIEQEE
jgi:hypothetical protein